MAVPQKASAYVDPGTGSMMWQMAAAALIGSLFYLRRVAGWVRIVLGLRSSQSMGFLFATSLGVAISAVTLQLFGGHPLPRFNDVFLVGIVVTAYLFTWESAAYLMVISILVSAWILPPNGTLRVDGFAEWYRLASFTVVSILLISLITRMKTRRSQEPIEERDHEPVRGMAAGD
jgi:K+-sensing histidine kinase KdpD